MAIFYDAPVPPVALTTFVRSVPQPSNLSLLAAFPTRSLQTNKIDFAEILRTNRTARFRSFDGRIHVSERDGGSDKQVPLLPLSSSLSVGELERLLLEFARTGGTRTEALADATYNDAENLTNEVWNRLELAWGDLLDDGKITIDEEGLQGEYDFGVPANHLVTAGVLWSNTAAPILSDLIAWSDTYEATNGTPPGAFRVPRAVARNMQINTQLINAAHGAQTGKTRVTIDEINDVLNSEGLPPVTVQDIAKLDVDGTVTPSLPDNKVLLTPEALSDLGYTAFGVSATALELVSAKVAEFSFSDAPGIVGVVEKVGPPYRQFTFVDATALPILTDSKRLFVATVR